MKFPVKLPRVADTVDEVVVEGWEAQLGSEVSAGDVLLKVETDKALVEIPSPVAGRLVEQAVAQGDEVTTGAVLGVIESD